MRRRPDERWFAVKLETVVPVHPIEAACWHYQQGLVMSPAIDRAIEIYEEPFERERLQPWILAGATDADIEERVGLSIETVRAYRHLFFDTKVFRDQLEKQLWVARYDGTSEGAAYLQIAVLQGIEAIAHVMGAPCKLDPQQVIEQSMRELFFRGQAIRHARLTSPETSVAHSLLKSAVEQAQLQSKTRPPNITDVMLKLKNRDMTQHVADVVPHGEILH